MHNQKQLSFSLETSKEDLQRHISHLEHELAILRNKNLDLEKELNICRQRSMFDQERQADLENVLANERMALHERESRINRLEAEQSDLMRDNDRYRGSQYEGTRSEWRRSSPIQKHDDEISDRSYEKR